MNRIASRPLFSHLDREDRELRARAVWETASPHVYRQAKRKPRWRRGVVGAVMAAVVVAAVSHLFACKGWSTLGRAGAALEGAGYTEIEFGAPAVTECGQSQGAWHWIALRPDGARAWGVVCCGEPGQACEVRIPWH